MSMAAATFTHPHNLFSTPSIPKQPFTTKPRHSPFAVRMSLQENAPSLAVVGVTGAVGQEFLSVLSDRDFPYRSIKMLASKRSAGKQMTFQDRSYTVEELTADSFDGVDIALFSAGGSISKAFGPAAVEKGTIVVDNSSAFRMVDGIPLVIPEVNPEAMDGIKVGMGKGALIANPNCSTIICLMAATPLHRRAKVLRMVVSTYQAASGAGAAAMEELELQTREVLEGLPPTCNIFSQQYAFNLFSHNAPVQSNGYNEEEMKLVKETRKIWSDLDVKVTATCIRVPVMRAHAESINLQFEKPLDEVLLSSGYSKGDSEERCRSGGHRRPCIQPFPHTIGSIEQGRRGSGQNPSRSFSRRESRAGHLCMRGSNTKGSRPECHSDCGDAAIRLLQLIICIVR
ncbi:Aspartate-semialdehyde dehydrogenase [Linum grandiflorum]